MEARLLLGRALLACADTEQASTTFLTALEQSIAMPMPLRAADALDALASTSLAMGGRRARDLAAAAAAIRLPHRAASWGYAAQYPVEASRTVPSGWVHEGMLTTHGLAEVAEVFAGQSGGSPTILDQLTVAERQVADRVADGLTSRQIGEELYVSPRTVDAHLTNIYRKLGINTRAKLAAMVVDGR